MTKPPNIPALMAAIDEAGAKLKKCGVERRARQEQLNASITAEAIAAAEYSGLQRALALIDVEAKPQPEKPKRAYTRRNKGASEIRSDGHAAAPTPTASPGNSAVGAPLNTVHQTDDPFPILPRARA